ncbi:MAG: 3'-5' exonuclease [Proteobacteria bacterium]|nr:3'-5' exonuclease [Pseudomonadota bacterium]
MGWFLRLIASPLRGAADRARWVVVDCESSGLDPRADRLLAIGAVGVEGGRIAVGSGFSVVLRQQAPSDPANIVIHEISGDEQLSGIDCVDALNRFAQYAGDAPLVAFHAPFDRALLKRACRGARLALRNRWLDLAALAPALHPEMAPRCKALDDWLAEFGIENPRRHDALSDAYATALLFQVLLDAARRQGAHTCAEVLGAAGGRRWLVAG